MKVTIDLNRSVEENASYYFDKAKKHKKKRDGAMSAVEDAKKKLEKISQKHKKESIKDLESQQEQQILIDRKKQWYEKFRWFRTSDGLLCIGGRDATTNEIVIKKHTDAKDLVFHTDMAGSPFFVIKSEGEEISQQSIREAADATATFSKAWKLGISNTPVFYVKPEQVTKEAKSGEFLPKGAFMIRGKTYYTDNLINLAVGVTEDHAVMAGPVSAVKAHCKAFCEVIQGTLKASEAAKKIQKKIGLADLDEIIRALPAGTYRIK